MDPKGSSSKQLYIFEPTNLAVRPDRDTAGRSHPVRHRRARLVIENISVEENEVVGEDSDDWIRKLPVDMRTLLMQIMNIEVLVCKFLLKEKILFSLSVKKLAFLLIFGKFMKNGAFFVVTACSESL